MSRCFPFPPPGYELKARPDDVNLIIKDKQKHKKHEDKKEKDKKEGSERKEKERSEHKHKVDKKEGSERKEKERSEHKHKEDKKEGSERKEKERSGHKHKEDKKEGSERKEKERSEHKHKEDKKRKRKEHKDKKDAEDHNKEKRSCLGVLLENQNGPKLVPDVAKLGKEQENGNGMLAIMDNTDHERMIIGQSPSFWVSDKVERTKEGKEGHGNRNVVGDKDDCKNEEQIKTTKVQDEKTKEEKDLIKNKKEEKKERKEEKRRRKEEKKKRKEEKKKRKEQKKKENNDFQGKLPKLEEFNDFLDAKGNGVQPYNMSRPAIVSHKAGPTGGSFRPSQNTINVSVGERAVITDQKVNPKLSSPQSVIDGVRNVGPCLTANNRKTDNGRLSANNNVVSNGVIPPHFVCIERKVEPYQTSNGAAMIDQIVNRSANGKIPSSHPFGENEGNASIQAPDAFHKMMHKKESRMNDSLAGKKSSSSMPLSAPLKGKEKVATTTKPPHPDLKYLSQILAVPEVEWPQYDDQGWLFDHKDSQSKRPEIQWTKQVWSEAVELDSADVIALPYVIPY